MLMTLAIQVKNKAKKYKEVFITIISAKKQYQIFSKILLNKGLQNKQRINSGQGSQRMVRL